MLSYGGFRTTLVIIIGEPSVVNCIQIGELLRRYLSGKCTRAIIF